MFNWFKTARNSVAPVPSSVVLKFTYGELVLTDPYGECYNVPADGAERSFGRAAHSDYMVLHPRVSRQHALIRSRDGNYEIKDRSANGTLVNGRRVGKFGWHPVQDGDEVTLGDVTLQATFCE